MTFIFDWKSYTLHNRRDVSHFLSLSTGHPWHFISLDKTNEEFLKFSLKKPYPTSHQNLRHQNILPPLENTLDLPLVPLFLPLPWTYFFLHNEVPSLGSDFLVFELSLFFLQKLPFLLTNPLKMSVHPLSTKLFLLFNLEFPFWPLAVHTPSCSPSPPLPSLQLQSSPVPGLLRTSAQGAPPPREHLCALLCPLLPFSEQSPLLPPKP